MQRPTRLWVLAIAAGVCAGAAHLATAGPGTALVRNAGSEVLRARYVRPSAVPFPSNNAWSEPREQLGRTLFFDPRLSGSGVIACATCHNPGLSWGDGLAVGVGHASKPLSRRSPTVLNLAWAQALFWDGRAASLEEQALGPIAAPGEMNLPLDQLVPKLRAVPGYAERFERAYPGEGITTATIAKAIATFERTVTSARAPFDLWIAGDENAISEEAQRGFVLFNDKANCALCHSGWRLTDDSFHDIGAPGEDLGRGAILAGIEILEHAFKTPTLRDADRRAPYLHDGSEPTLESVVELYDLGGRVRRPSLAREIGPLGLTEQEKRELVAFLRTLTSDDAAVAVPRLPR